MPHICPRPCSRLATAAVFISVGVVQFVVGIILLRSKFAYLLAGPDFWTSCSNIAVGCLLGVTASIWKESKKRKSTKHIIRRNILLALMFSALTINATTLGIFLLSEGNNLLSIRLESTGVYNNTTFVSEVLAYAYTTSICSPIVCIVVSIVAMSESCVISSVKKDSTKMKTPLNSLKKERSQSFQWVYTPEMLALAKKKSLEILLTSSDSSSDESPEEDSVRQKYANSVEDLERVLQRMAQGKRDSILNDSTAMLRQLEHRRRNKYSSQIRDGSYPGLILSQTKESDVKGDTDDRSPYARNAKSYRHSFAFDGNTNGESTGDVGLERVAHRKSTQPNISYRSPYATDEILNEYQNASSQLAAENFLSQKRNFKENSLIGSEMHGVKLKHGSDDIGRKLNGMVSVHKAGIKLPIVYTNPSDVSIDHYSLKNRHEVSRDSREISENENLKSRDASKSKERSSPHSNDCFSPDGSDFADSFDFARTSSWAGEVIPINVKANNPPPPPARSSQKLIAVSSPVVPDLQEITFQKPSGNIESTSDEDLNSESLKGNRKGNVSSFSENAKARKENTQEYPKVGSQSIKKYDLARVLTMSSISEEPGVDACSSLADAWRCEKPSTSKEATSYLKKKSISSTHSESPRVQYQGGTENLGQDGTPRRISACKTLRRLWSSYGSEREMDFLQHVVDKDSLIGLSEEELIARQIRTRSIRKAIQQRIKEREMAF